MTPEEAISILDKNIAYIKSQINSVSYNNGEQIEERGRHLKILAINALQMINCRKHTLQAIENISFHSYFSNHLLYQIYTAHDIEEDLQKCFRNGINAIIEILQQEREHFIRIKEGQDKQKESAIQKRNNRIQTWTLITSIIAIILSAISLGFTIFS